MQVGDLVRYNRNIIQNSLFGDGVARIMNIGMAGDVGFDERELSGTSGQGLYVSPDGYAYFGSVSNFEVVTKKSDVSHPNYLVISTDNSYKDTFNSHTEATLFAGGLKRGCVVYKKVIEYKFTRL